MRDGFVKVAAGTPEIRVADCRYNAEQIFTLMREADKQGVRVLALPELCLTGYTCGDLFLQDTLLKGAEEGLATVLEATKNLDMLTALGLPVKNPWDGKLYNCAAVIHDLCPQLWGVLRGALVHLRQGPRCPLESVRPAGQHMGQGDLGLRHHARPGGGGGDL